MTNVAGSGPQGNAEDAYKSTRDPVARRRIQAAVVAACREQIRGFVRRYVPAGHREEGEQVCALGVLVALEKYDPAFGPDGGADRGKKSFWGFAFSDVRHELQTWMSAGVWWCKDPNRGASPQRRARAEEAKRYRKVASLDTTVKNDGDAPPLVECIPAPDASVEDEAGDVEALRMLRAFCATLDAREARILLSEHLQVMGSRHYSTLVSRARAAVRGSEDDGLRGHDRDDDRRAVRGDREARGADR